MPQPTLRGKSVRTPVRMTEQDRAVVRAVGEHLGHLRNKDLAELVAAVDGPCFELGRRKRALTEQCSGRWAGAIVRSNAEQVRLTTDALYRHRRTLRKRIPKTKSHQHRRRTWCIGRRAQGHKIARSVSSRTASQQSMTAGTPAQPTISNPELEDPFEVSEASAAAVDGEERKAGPASCNRSEDVPPEKVLATISSCN